MGKLANIWAFIGRHKYWVTFGLFLLIIGVLDENSLIQRVSHKREIHQLKTEIQRYRKQYEEDSKALKEITSNKEALEKVAREKYLMKRRMRIFLFLRKTNKWIRKEMISWL